METIKEKILSRIPKMTRKMALLVISLAKSGTLEAMTLTTQEGDVFLAGSVILQIDDKDQGLSLEEKQASYLDAEAQYDHLVEFEYQTAKAGLSRLTSVKDQAKMPLTMRPNYTKKGPFPKALTQSRN